MGLCYSQQMPLECMISALLLQQSKLGYDANIDLSIKAVLKVKIL